jgi:diguanylate cyclase
METSDYLDQAAEYMRLAIPMMKKYGVAMTPENYSLWYEYVSGNNAELTKTLTECIEQDESITEKKCLALYSQFFDRGRDQLLIQEMRDELRRVLLEVLNLVSSGVTSSDQISSKLQACLTQFDHELTQEEVREVVEDVVSQTRIASSNGDQLSERLNVALSDIEEIKKDIEQAKQEAKLDTLTGLSNRKSFDESLLKVTMEADKNDSDVCVILCDLDFFSSINIKHGHLVGDQVLRVVANSLKNTVKGRDLVVRHGGEEFAILLLNTSLTNVNKLAESIRLDIAAKRIQRKDTRQPLGVITMSFGIARYVPSEGAESFMQRVDRALYMSKRNGRNSVSEAPPPALF